MLVLENGEIGWGDCAAVQYSGAGGRDPLFLAKDFIPIIEKYIKPVLVGNDGEIKQIDQGIGMDRAVNRMLRQIEKMELPGNRKVRITQCDSKELCVKIARVLSERFGFEDIKIISANGISTVYENPGGVVIAL